jgi:hypothetical protein
MFLLQLRSLRLQSRTHRLLVVELLDRTKQANDQLTSAQRPLGVLTPEVESFGHKVDEDVYRCMLCLRQFSGDSSLK